MSSEPVKTISNRPCAQMPSGAKPSSSNTSSFSSDFTAFVNFVLLMSFGTYSLSKRLQKLSFFVAGFQDFLLLASRTFCCWLPFGYCCWSVAKWRSHWEVVGCRSKLVVNDKADMRKRTRIDNCLSLCYNSSK